MVNLVLHYTGTATKSRSRGFKTLYASFETTNGRCYSIPWGDYLQLGRPQMLVIDENHLSSVFTKAVKKHES